MHELDPNSNTGTSTTKVYKIVKKLNGKPVAQPKAKLLSGGRPTPNLLIMDVIKDKDKRPAEFTSKRKTNLMTLSERHSILPAEEVVSSSYLNTPNE